jgi:hypothetical protein
MTRWLSLLFACGLLPAQQAQDVAPDPQNLQERWDSYIEKTFSWKRIATVTAETAFDQTFQLRKCGRPPFCFPHEIGGALTRRTARTTMELAAGALLHEDLRRRPSNLPGFRRRLSYALLHAPLARDRDGDWRPAYSRFAGTLGAVAVTSAWEGRPLTAANLSEHFGLTATSYFQDALMTEFGPDLKRMGHHFADRLRHPRQ